MQSDEHVDEHADPQDIEHSDLHPPSQFVLQPEHPKQLPRHVPVHDAHPIPQLLEQTDEHAVVHPIPHESLH